MAFSEERAYKQEAPCARPELLFFYWGYSSAGRALEWHSRGQEFDPP